MKNFMKQNLDFFEVDHECEKYSIHSITQENIKCNFSFFYFLFELMTATKVIPLEKQIKNKFLSHFRILNQLENDPIFHKMTTNKLNKIFRETGELSYEFLIRRTNEEIDGSKAGRYKIIPDRTSFMEYLI